MNQVIPIILSGGGAPVLFRGTIIPKPFMVVAGKPLLAHAFERAALIADKALIVTNQTHYFLTENDPKRLRHQSFLFASRRVTGYCAGSAAYSKSAW